MPLSIVTDFTMVSPRGELLTSDNRHSGNQFVMTADCGVEG